MEIDPWEMRKFKLLDTDFKISMIMRFSKYTTRQRTMAGKIKV